MNPELQPVVFGHAFEALVKALKDRVTPELRGELKKLGVDLAKVQAAYPMDTWVEVIRLTGEKLLPQLPPAERTRQLGHLFMEGFVQTPLGLAVLAVAKLIGVKRTLQRMGRNFKQATNYLEADIADLGPKSVRIRTFTNERYLPYTTDRTSFIAEYRQGLLEAVLTTLGATGTVKLSASDFTRQDVTFEVSWS